MKDKSKVPVLHIDTGKGYVKAMLIDDFLELMKNLKSEVNNGKDLMPQDYMRIWNGLKMVLNKARKEEYGRENN